MRFYKMQALANDYIYIETLTQNIASPEEWAVFLSDRRRGIGSDGLVLLCPSEKADFKMRIFNPDGSEAEMCGNALRSTAKLAYALGFTKKHEFTIETLSGIKNLFLETENGKVTMITAAVGAPCFEAKAIPVLINAERCIDYPIAVAEREFRLNAVSIGNPHCVTFVDDVHTIDLPLYGRAIERNSIFPQYANVEFAEITGGETAFMRTWERNCGETFACGTGCCATASVGYLTGRCGKKLLVHQLGGIIRIELEEDFSNIYMTGPSEIICSGDVDEQNLTDFKASLKKSYDLR